MAINQLHFSNLKAGRCKEIVVTCLLRFWETSNVKKACERLDVDLVLWTRSLLIHVLAHIAFEACRIQNLPKLVEDIFQTSINTDPGGALRLVQRRSGLCWVRGEWLNDILSKTLDTSCELKFFFLVVIILLFLINFPFYLLFNNFFNSWFIASAPTFFPPEYVKEFQQSSSTSIAQVCSSASEDVVIKVLKPGTEDFLVAGLNFTYDVSRIFEFLSLEFGRTSLVSSLSSSCENPVSSVLI
ncbi:hypothetical protein Bca4012_078357 [Brassica carinata]|nr:unnamed protein product [Brassica oleracea]